MRSIGTCQKSCTLGGGDGLGLNRRSGILYHDDLPRAGGETKETPGGLVAARRRRLMGGFRCDVLRNINPVPVKAPAQHQPGRETGLPGGMACSRRRNL